jgi:hypothetical protein
MVSVLVSGVEFVVSPESILGATANGREEVSGC